MAQTENYDWQLPTPGGSAGVWGNILNEALDAVDGTLALIEASVIADLATLDADLATLDAAKLNRSGGLMNGPTRHALVELGNVSGSTTINLAQGNVFRCTVQSNTVSFSFVNPPAATEPMFVAIELQAGSSPSVSWPTTTWDGGSAPDLTQGHNVVVLMIRGTTRRGTHAVRP